MKGITITLLLVSTIFGLTNFMPMVFASCPTGPTSSCPTNTYYSEYKDPGIQLQACYRVDSCGGSPWRLDPYTCTPGSVASISWAGSGSITASASDNSSCGLAGAHADYKADGACYWDNGGTGLGCHIALNSQCIACAGGQFGALTSSYTVTASSCISGCPFNSYADVYDDFWIYWTVPVGPNSFQNLEFMLQLSGTGCGQGDAFLTGTSSYLYFHHMNCINVGSPLSVTISGSDLTLLILKALCNIDPVLGNCRWNIPTANGYITGMDFGIEVGNGRSLSATLSASNLIACATNVQSRAGLIGYIPSSC